ncbi:hypothetical protein Fmac_011953 [Flemingia macrophylla]|uniref:Uncharacterized protein n=1 Tax=Flemingia macrophylla TaxID=520843 RepID=A0ABD1MNY0_9FABA
MEGDEELLRQTEVKVEPKKDEWMTTLPPERKDEYIKAYYAASLKQQQELEEAAKTPLSNTPPADDPSSSTSNRQVGMKSKCEEDDDGTEWEEATFTDTL